MLCLIAHFLWTKTRGQCITVGKQLAKRIIVKATFGSLKNQIFFFFFFCPFFLFKFMLRSLDLEIKFFKLKEILGLLETRN